MESEFDKEIDVLLRQSAQRGALTTEPLTAHLDADEINAFAEQLLSGKARARAVEHLADCARCRNILANIAVFNAEADSEIINPTGEKKVLATPEIPWYRKLFVFPQIAYAMGVLALIFGGIIAVTVLKNATRSNSSEVAQMEKNDAAPQSTIAPAAASNSAVSVSGENSANALSRSAPANENIATGATPKAAGRETQTANNSIAPAEKNVELAKPKPAPAEDSANKKEKNDVLSAAPPPMAVLKSENYSMNAAPPASVLAEPQAETEKKATAGRKDTNQLLVNGRAAQPALKVAKNRAASPAGAVADAAKDADESAKTKKVGGKNFRRANGVWYDSDFQNQKTINVARNSEDYKKLDANIRAIADSLSGVVVIVAGSKAYRIQ